MKSSLSSISSSNPMSPILTTISRSSCQPTRYFIVGASGVRSFWRTTYTSNPYTGKEEPLFFAKTEWRDQDSHIWSTMTRIVLLTCIHHHLVNGLFVFLNTVSPTNLKNDVADWRFFRYMPESFLWHSIEWRNLNWATTRLFFFFHFHSHRRSLLFLPSSSGGCLPKPENRSSNLSDRSAVLVTWHRSPERVPDLPDPRHSTPPINQMTCLKVLAAILIPSGSPSCAPRIML